MTKHREVKNTVSIPQHDARDLDIDELAKLGDEIIENLLHEHKINAVGLLSIGLNLITFAIGNSNVQAKDLREVIDETLTYAFNLRAREDDAS